MLSATSLSMATRCLWSLQEAAPEIEALLVAQVDGLTLTSTLQAGEHSQRLAAVSSTMFLLSEQMASLWAYDESLEVLLHLVSKEDKQEHIVSLKPAGTKAVLVSLYRFTSRANLIEMDLNLAAKYVEMLLKGFDVAPPVHWSSR